MLNILHERLRYYLDYQIPKEQAGFVHGKGTREQILNVRQIIEKCREFNMPLVLCFIDYNKAFDGVQWNTLWRVLKKMGVPEHLTMLLQNLYVEGTASVRLQDTHSHSFKPESGVRQGCILSPVLLTSTANIS